MSEAPKIPPASELLRTGSSAPLANAPNGSTVKDRAGVRPTGAVFEALFERLTARAADLEAKTRNLSEPGQLPGAVDAARASLEDALSLGEGLLEAFRAAQQSGEVKP